MGLLPNVTIQGIYTCTVLNPISRLLALSKPNLRVIQELILLAQNQNIRPVLLLNFCWMLEPNKEQWSNKSALEKQENNFRKWSVQMDPLKSLNFGPRVVSNEWMAASCFLPGSMTAPPDIQMTDDSSPRYPENHPSDLSAWGSGDIHPDIQILEMQATWPPAVVLSLEEWGLLEYWSIGVRVDAF